MARPPAQTQREKTVIIMDVLSGHSNLSQAAERAGVSAQAIANWRNQFIEAGSAGLRPHYPRPIGLTAPEIRMHQLVREINELKLALAEAHLALNARAAGRTAVPRLR